MLTKIDRIEGTGLFAAAGPSTDFERVTLVFGENGRGKSTLAAVLRSCAENNGELLRARITLGQETAQRAVLSFKTGAADVSQATLDAGAWDRPIPGLVVFDAEFVARNVYAGQEISSDQRASLLDFSLGEDAVATRVQHDSYTEPLRLANGELRTATAVIDTARGSIPLNAYRELPNVPDVDARLQEAQRTLQAALAIGAVRARPVGADLLAPTFNIENLFLILRKNLPIVEAEAEARVKEHIAGNARHGFEAWISSGLDFVNGDACPFCESNIAGSKLIAAYRAHFNEEYRTLKSQAADLVRGVQTRTDANQIDRLEREFQVSQAQQEQWREHLDIRPTTLDSNMLREKYKSLHDLLVPLATAKSHAPLEAFGSLEHEANARALWAELLAIVDATNAQIKCNREAIAAYKAGLENSNVDQIRSSITTLSATKVRHSPAGIAQLVALEKAVAEKARLTAEKDAARVKLDTLMTQTLDQYGERINQLLHDFGAQIRVRNLGISFRGAQNRPRTDYGLEVRGAPILLTNDQGPNFGNSLSEGDKRALAFAFFMARVLSNAGLAERTVVIDDPMCSLDRHRRATTLRVLKRLALACRQLILIAHDIWFLRDFDDGLEKMPKAHRPRRAYAKISRIAGNLSSFEALDIADECRSPYQRNLTDVLNFALGADNGAGKELVAKSLRPLIEGYIHRRFPLNVPRNRNLGDVLKLIRDAGTGDPLHALGDKLEELQALNDYTIPFMHVEGEPAPDLSQIEEGELAAYSERAVRVVYG
ncbi:AAA family ATPase [Stenotrophomonas aracearum]|jgi:wobble nucleotide-excising tRNase|uniref:AAA family ATPase n=1 Tax=Stenotrophomonas aracearum TaxID=3003272 RepID=A0ABY9YC82_9GAMM|nr:AAA family ATPase [Stenotrophomonas sp. A5588]WNH48300.1 AAA family ATPase [Stenotrophomonas sp. A5588]